VLKRLDKVGVSSRFDQRMSAKFAMELEREVQEKNTKLIAINQKATTS